MRKNASLLAACLLFSAVRVACADIAAIHANALPQEPAVLTALDDARAL